MISDFNILHFALLCVVGFFASMVDAIAGGGGIISLPAYLVFGIKPQMALGTNKFSGTASSLTSSFQYFRFRKTNFSLLKYLIPWSLLGSSLGVFVVLNIDQNKLRLILIVLIVSIGFYSLFSRKMGESNLYKGFSLRTLFWGSFFAFLLGFYDGFFGPGTGSFLLFLFVKLFHFDFLHATGNAKVLNFISNITSLFLFALNGKIVYLYAIPVSIFMIFGAICGSKIAFIQGVKIIKPLFVIMSIAIAIKLFLNYLGIKI